MEESRQVGIKESSEKRLARSRLKRVCQIWREEVKSCQRKQMPRKWGKGGSEEDRDCNFIIYNDVVNLMACNSISLVFHMH